MITEQDVIDFLKKLDYRAQQSLLEKVYTEQRVINEKKYRQSKESRKRTQEKFEKRSLELFEKVEPGDIVQVIGTKDGWGYREVLEKKFSDLVCRKLVIPRTKKGIRDYRNPTVFERDSYITTHGKRKIKKILTGLKIKD